MYSVLRHTWKIRHRPVPTNLRHSCRLLGIHSVVIVFLGGLEVIILIVVFVVDHFILLDGHEVDLITAGTTATCDDVRGVDLGKFIIVLFLDFGAC
jgi:hypothetical protein